MPVITYLSMPYIGMDEDGSTTRNWAHFTFKHKDGKPVPKRRVKREVRKWIKRNLGRAVLTEELRAVVRRVQYIETDN